MSLLGGTLSILDLVSKTEFLIPFPFLSQGCSSQTPLNPMVAPGKYLESLLTWRNSDWCFLPIYLACNLFCQLECYSMFLSIILSASFPVSLLSFMFFYPWYLLARLWIWHTHSQAKPRAFAICHSCISYPCGSFTHWTQVTPQGWQVRVSFPHHSP